MMQDGDPKKCRTGQCSDAGRSSLTTNRASWGTWAGLLLPPVSASAGCGATDAQSWMLNPSLCIKLPHSI